jgi:4-aminobutyrate aminotransferase/(S)-3-amino-2-methylpropionate transaminase
MDGPGMGGLGSTFAGNPLSCVAALATIDMIEKEGLLRRAVEIGDRFEARDTGRANGPWWMTFAAYCWRHGLVTITAGTYNNVLRILVPLVIRDEQFDEGLDVIEAALDSVKGAREKQKDSVVN